MVVETKRVYIIPAKQARCLMSKREMLITGDLVDGNIVKEGQLKSCAAKVDANNRAIDEAEKLAKRDGAEVRRLKR